MTTTLRARPWSWVKRDRGECPLTGKVGTRPWGWPRNKIKGIGLIRVPFRSWASMDQLNCHETGQEKRKRKEAPPLLLRSVYLGASFDKVCIFKFISVHEAAFRRDLVSGLSHDRHSITNPQCGRTAWHKSIFTTGTNI